MAGFRGESFGIEPAETKAGSVMLTTLKSIFRPTGLKIGLAVLVGLPLMVVGALLATPHPTAELETLQTILFLGVAPLRLLAEWGLKLPSWLWIALAWPLNLLYYYLVVCIVSSPFSIRAKE